MDKMREEFEKHLTERLGESFERFTNQAALDAFWLIWKESWQASRAALVVELPPEHEVAHGYDARELVYAIKNAGIKCS